MDLVHGVVHGPRSMFCIRPLNTPPLEKCGHAAAQTHRMQAVLESEDGYGAM